jgi:hypothetical protein
MRKPLRLLPLAMVLVAAVAFPAAASANVAPGTYSATLNSANAPTGAAKPSTPPTCTVNQNLTISCNSYTLGGVGHTNATVSLTANYTATIDCTNKGGNLVEVQAVPFSSTSTATVSSTKNGQLSVPAQSAGPSPLPNVCPNGNWTPSIRPGTLVLRSFTYTLTFAGFTSPYITISATDP